MCACSRFSTEKTCMLTRLQVLGGFLIILTTPFPIFSLALVGEQLVSKEDGL